MHIVESQSLNSNQHVIMQRLSIGDPSLRASQLGTPASNLIDARGDVANYMTNSTAIADFPWMQLAENEYAWVAETYFSSPDFDLPGYLDWHGCLQRFGVLIRRSKNDPQQTVWKETQGRRADDCDAVTVVHRRTGRGVGDRRSRRLLGSGDAPVGDGRRLVSAAQSISRGLTPSDQYE
jgi:hypothetical protein